MLTRDHSCLRDLLWRIELREPSPSRVLALAEHLSKVGWIERSAVPQLRDLEGPDGHRLVIVVRTGRIQLRVHYLTAHAERQSAAQRLHDDLLAIETSLMN